MQNHHDYSAGLGAILFDYKADVKFFEEGIAQRDSINSILKDENKVFNKVDSLHQVERKSWKKATRKKVLKGVVGGTGTASWNWSYNATGLNN